MGGSVSECACLPCVQTLAWVPECAGAGCWPVSSPGRAAPAPSPAHAAEVPRVPAPSQPHRGPAPHHPHFTGNAELRQGASLPQEVAEPESGPQAAETPVLSWEPVLTSPRLSQAPGPRPPAGGLVTCYKAACPGASLGGEKVVPGSQVVSVQALRLGVLLGGGGLGVWVQEAGGVCA